MNIEYNKSVLKDAVKPLNKLKIWVIFASSTSTLMSILPPFFIGK